MAERETEPAIALSGVTKLYARSDGRADTLKENLLTTLARRERRNVVTALEDVSLEIRRGAAVGLVNQPIIDRLPDSPAAETK